MSDSIRVMVVDDHPVVRRGIKSLLSEEEGIQLVGEAVNGRDALQKVESLKPDVILMDLVMPEMNGIEAIEKITAAHPDVRILVMTSFAADDKVFPSIKAGALGYLLKDSDPEDLIRMIRQVYRGELWPCSSAPTPPPDSGWFRRSSARRRSPSSARTISAS